MKELRDKLEGLKFERKRLDGLDKDIRATQQQIIDEQRSKEKNRTAAVLKEKNKLVKENVLEGKIFFVCPKCKKNVPVVLGKSIMMDSAWQILVEAYCNCSKSTAEYGENAYLSNRIIYTILKEGASKYKCAVLGHT